VILCEPFKGGKKKKNKKGKEKIQQQRLPTSYIMVEALKNIARELQDQIKTADIYFLEYWVTKRYIEEVMSYFDYSFSAGLIGNIQGDISYKKLKEYRKRNQRLIVKYLKTEYKHAKNQYVYWLNA
jgi:hypothetical protein